MTVQCLDKIQQGCKLKMDDSGNILVKRLSDASIHVNIPKDENTVTIFKRETLHTKSKGIKVGGEVIKLNGLLDLEKPLKMFDMKKFQININRELGRKYPNYLKLEQQVFKLLVTEVDSSSCFVSVFPPFHS